jgi:hypothetical protein
MSGGSAGGGGVGAIDNLEALVKLMTDTKGFAARLKELREAELAAKTEADRLSEVQHTVVTARTDLENKTTALAAAVAKHTAEAVDYQKNRDRTLAALNQRDAELRDREATLNTERAEFDRHESAKRAELERREAVLAEREATARSNTERLAQVQERLARRSQALQAALAAE